jgi:metal-responsive CopG/Arc/MetJ family transcriptional regulator
MSTTVAISLPSEDLAALDRVCRDHGVSRHDAVQDALLWYIEREGNLPPVDDPAAEIEP